MIRLETWWKGVSSLFLISLWVGYAAPYIIFLLRVWSVRPSNLWYLSDWEEFPSSWSLSFAPVQSPLLIPLLWYPSIHFVSACFLTSLGGRHSEIGSGGRKAGPLIQPRSQSWFWCPPMVPLTRGIAYYAADRSTATATKGWVQLAGMIKEYVCIVSLFCAIIILTLSPELILVSQHSLS